MTPRDPLKNAYRHIPALDGNTTNCGVPIKTVPVKLIGCSCMREECRWPPATCPACISIEQGSKPN